ncbi:hypothetical protein J2T60_001901 [Natronospira proteinivora]|uniref:Glycosyl transferase family 2 n=1 Tax=Natronospira proteinivora TaxID=1807133 RepID=A0ABT1G998_9GAMM|nr:hypothetical protein [Natronospira proteinivora]MCP1727901.1 hypothetical protein [Natronospira proteinivora]
MSQTLEAAYELMRMARYDDALAQYRKAQAQTPELAHLLDYNIRLCEARKAGEAPEAGAIEHQSSPQIDVTLTTISSRLDRIIPVLHSLSNQSLTPRRIVLYLSEDPRLLDNGVSRKDPRLGPIRKMERVEIKWTRNTGSYRKIVPYVEECAGEESASGQLFVTADDDTLYPYYFLERLYQEYLRSKCVVAFRGRRMCLAENEIAPYSEWQLGVPEPSFLNVPTGKDGVIYSTSFFTDEFMDMGGALDAAPTADDLWIKWHTALNGVRSIVLRPKAATSDYESFPVVDYSKEYRDVSLYKAHNSSGSGNKNDDAVGALEKYFSANYGYSVLDVCKAL